MKLFEKLTIAALAVTTGVFATATGIAHKTNKDLKAEDVNINNRIDDIQNQIDEINKQIKALEEKEAADIAEVKADYNAKIELLQNAILAVNQSVDELSLHVEDINEAINERIDDVIASLNSAIEALEKADVDNKTELTNKIVELKALVEQYKTALEQADTNLANTLLQKIATEKETLTILIGDKVSALETAMNTKVAEIKADYDAKIKVLKDELAKLINDTDSRLDALETAIESMNNLTENWSFLQTPIDVGSSGAAIESRILGVRAKNDTVEYYMKSITFPGLYYVDDYSFTLTKTGTPNTYESLGTIGSRIKVNYYNTSYGEYQTDSLDAYFTWTGTSKTNYSILNSLTYYNCTCYWSSSTVVDKDFAKSDKITFAEDITIANKKAFKNLAVYVNGVWMRAVSKGTSLGEGSTNTACSYDTGKSYQTTLDLGYYIVSGTYTWNSSNNRWYMNLSSYKQLTIDMLSL